MSEAKQGNEGATIRVPLVLKDGSANPVVAEEKALVRKDGSKNPAVPTVEEKEEAAIYAPLAERVAKSRLHEIAKRIDDPNFSQIDLMKLICAEMTAILLSQNAILDYVSQKNTASYNKVATKEVIISLNEQLKGVELLGRQITNMDNLAKRDYINFDGDKFRWIALQWADLGASALRRIGLNESQVHSWYGHYRVEMQENQERIRRDAEKQVWLQEKEEKEKAQNATK